MNETTFENAQVGDKVECLMMGSGVVIEVKDGLYPIGVEFPGDIPMRYTKGGYYNTLFKYRTLHWPGSITRHADGRIEVNPQPRPKRKATRAFSTWAILRQDGTYHYGGFSSEDAAKRSLMQDGLNPNNYRVVYLTGSYEAEE